MKRTFIAISVSPPSSFKAIFISLKDKIQGNIKWSKTNKFHLTLGFFASTSLKQEKQIIATINKVASKNEQFVIQFRGLGVFPSKNDPRVLWLGLVKNQQLFKIYKELWLELSRYGFTNDKKKFAPHITLSRIRHMDDKTPLLKILSENYNKNMFESKVQDILYFESTLTPDGPIYKVLGKYSLS